MADPDRVRELELAVAGMAAANQHMTEQIRVLEAQTKVTEVHVVRFEFGGKMAVYATYDLARASIEKHITFLRGHGNPYYRNKAQHCLRAIEHLAPERDYWDTEDEWDDDSAPSIIYDREPLAVHPSDSLAW